jgi:hypothetical protein
MDKAVLKRIKRIRKTWAALKKAHDAQKEANVVRDLDRRTHRPANIPAHVELTPAAMSPLAPSPSSL